MDAKELRSRSPDELADELVKLRKEQFALRMQRATGQQPKPDQFGKVRRNIARLKTVLREKERAAGGKDK
jgi:large subunit ribosomal protein L29